jgi:hypothetical protein
MRYEGDIYRPPVRLEVICSNVLLDAPTTNVLFVACIRIRNIECGK